MAMEYKLPFTADEITEKLKNIDKIKWKNIEDKPFGEITTMSDVLTWDCNTDGLYTVECDGETLAHISDTVLTMDDLSSECSFIGDVGGELTGQNVPPNEIHDLSGDGFISIMGVMLVVPRDDYTFEEYDVTFAQKGIYVATQLSTMFSAVSFKIRDFVSFKTTEIKTIDEKFLPEPLRLVDDVTSKIIVNQKTIELTQDGGAYVGAIVMGNILEEGCTYTVVYDGVEYSDLKPLVHEIDGRLYITPDDGTFKISYHTNFGATLFETTNQMLDATIIVINNTVPRKVINVQSLPESHQFGELEGALLDNATFPLEDGMSFGMGVGLIGGNTYTVIYNGVEYAGLVAQSVDMGDDGMLVLMGNPSLLGDEDNGLPFIIVEQNGYMLVGDMTGATSCTVSIISKITKTIDAKLIPLVPQTFIINAEGRPEERNFNLDKSVAEILQAYLDGYMCFVHYEKRLIPLKTANMPNEEMPTFGMITFEDVDIGSTTGQANFFTIQGMNITGTDEITVIEKSLTFDNIYKYKQN